MSVGFDTYLDNHIERMADEVRDALHDTIDGCADAEHIRGRTLAFLRRLPEDMTVQEVLESLRVGAEDEDDD